MFASTKKEPALFRTEKLTVEFSCTFIQSRSSQTEGNVSVLTVASLDGTLSNTVSSEQVQKITIEFSLVKPGSNLEQSSLCHTHPVRGECPHSGK